MSEPRRPDPQQRWPERVAHRFRLSVKERTNRPPRDVSLRDLDESADVVMVAPEPRLPFAVRALIIVGLLVSAFGLMWAWQVWSQRSSEPIDSRLPMLTNLTDFSDLTDVSTPFGVVEAEPSPPAGSAPLDAAADASTPQHVVVAPIIVHVSGAVRLPGIVELTAPSRVFEAMERAGGALRSADLDRVNLAAAVIDGQRIHIPHIGETSAPLLVTPGSTSNGVSNDSQTAIININEAAASDLETLPGVGPTIAAAIVRTREERGPFLDVEELIDVAGIGESKLALLRPYVAIG